MTLLVPENVKIEFLIEAALKDVLHIFNFSIYALFRTTFGPKLIRKIMGMRMKLPQLFIFQMTNLREFHLVHT